MELLDFRSLSHTAGSSGQPMMARMDRIEWDSPAMVVIGLGMLAAAVAAAVWIG
jgi:hypothetical protein